MKSHSELIQGSPAWHAHRACYFNASDAPAMLGVSPYKTRTQLLREMATGVTAEVAPDLQRRFDDGHRFEALARPLGEKIIGEELYPVVGTEGNLSASFDGLTMLEEPAFEHKSLNEDLRAVMVEGCTGADLPMVYQVQMEQQCMVAGCSRVLFMASKWNGTELVEARHCWYTSNPELAARIRTGWDQFAEDLKAYKPEAVEAVAVAAAIEALPALVVSVEGRVVSSNLEPFRAAASAFLANIKTELETDQDFADAERVVKFCKDGEERLELVKAQALSQTATIDELFRTIDAISEQMRQKRLALGKTVDAKKISIRLEIVTGAQAQLDEHRKKLNERLGAEWVPRVSAGFNEAIKGKRTVASVKEAANVALANAKIDASALADRLDLNRKALVIDGTDWFFLFADFAHVGNAPAETFSAIAAQRIQKHKDAEAERAREALAKVDPAPVVQPRIAKDEPKGSPELSAALTSIAALPAESIGSFDVRVATPPSDPKPDTRPPINLGEINRRFGDGFTITRAFIEDTLHIPSSHTAKSSVFWKESDFVLICDALVEHIDEVAPA